MHSMAARAGALFRFLSEERIEYCVLGDTRDSAPTTAAPTTAGGIDPGSIDPGSIDPGSINPRSINLIVPTAARARMPAILKTFCSRNQMELVHHQRAPDRVECYGLSWLNREQRPEFVTINVRADYLRCGQVLFTAAEMLRDRQPASEVPGEGRGCFLVAPAREFICHLLRCIDRREISARDGSHLSAQWQQDSEGAAMQVDRFWNSAREGGVILRAAASGNWEPVHASAGALHAALHLRNVVPPAAWLHERVNGIRRWFHPAGLLIACLGPEGSGKSSVIRALGERPIPPFRQVHAMELRPHVMHPGPVKPGPQALQPRGPIGTIAKLMMFMADYWLGYWWRMRPKLVRSTLVVSNRYFDDVLVDPRRYRMVKPRAFVRLLLRWIPRPELWLVFDIPSDVLTARQADVAPEEATRQRGEYRRVLHGRENLVVLDAGQPLEDVVAQAQRAIVAELARRTTRQLGLPQDTTRNPAATRVLLFFCRRNVPLLSRLVRVTFNSDIQCRLPPDIHLPHPYGIVIHPQAVIGHRVTLMQQATIGGKDHSEKIAPIIGDDVYVGAGARVLGDVRIGHSVVIGANAVVTRDMPPGVTVVGANRIVASERGASAGAQVSGPSIARFPIGAQRVKKTGDWWK